MEFRSTSAVTLVSAGLASAFSLAACCALPVLMASAGIGSAWLGPIVTTTQPYATSLTLVSVAALLGSVAVTGNAAKHCRPGSLCARSGFRASVFGLAAVGFVLLLMSRIYA